MILLELVVIVLIVFFGRRFFWISIATGGFWLGFKLATYFLYGYTTLEILAVAGIFGLTCSALAYFLTHFMTAFIGFCLGGYAFAGLFQMLRLPGAFQAPFVPFFLGGLIVGTFIICFFDSAIIVLTSFFGANLIFDIMPGNYLFKAVVAVLLFSSGAFFQFNQFKKGRMGKFISKEIDMERLRRLYKYKKFLVFF